MACGGAGGDRRTGCASAATGRSRPGSERLRGGIRHDLTGYAVFVAMCAIIVFLQMAVQSRVAAVARHDHGAPAASRAAGAGVLAWLTPVAPVAPAVPAALAELPMTLAPWPASRRRRYRRRFSTRSRRTITSGGRARSRRDGHFVPREPRVGANMHSPLNCLPGNGWQIATWTRSRS